MMIDNIKGLLYNLNEDECDIAMNALKERKKDLENIKRRDIMIELKAVCEKALEIFDDCPIAEVRYSDDCFDDCVEDIYISNVLDYIKRNYI